MKGELIKLYGVICEERERLLFIIGGGHAPDGYFSNIKRQAMLDVAERLGVDQEKLDLPDESSDIWMF